MKRRLTVALAAGALMAAMAPGVASAEQGGVPSENGCSFPVGDFISQQAMQDGSNAGPNNVATNWINPNTGAPDGVPNAPGQNIKWRCVFYDSE